MSENIKMQILKSQGLFFNDTFMNFLRYSFLSITDAYDRKKF